MGRDGGRRTRETAGVQGTKTTTSHSMRKVKNINRGLKMKERWRVGSKKEDEKENCGDKPKITGKR